MGAVMLDRREFVKALLQKRGDLLVVSGLGSSTFDVAACGDNAANFHLWGAMGGAVMTGCGLALARPKARVAVLTGDGDLLMGLGSLATVGVKQPTNLAIVVLDNRHYGETGMQPSHTQFGIDLVRIAEGSRFAAARAISSMDELGEARKLLYETAGPVFIQVRVAATEDERVMTLRDGVLLKERFIRHLAETTEAP
jgi:thiamine pyrophosphate-dependent acetolactate synthase large subunit-like protein